MNDLLSCPVCDSDNKDLTIQGEYYILKCVDCGFEIKVHKDFTFPLTLFTTWNFNKRRRERG